ncbi:MAG: aminotransferase class IV [Planctomycetota bacterium]
MRRDDELVLERGAIVPASVARVDPRDALVVGGFGLIETLAVVDGVPMLLPEHLARLERSERELGVRPVPSERVEATVREFLAAAAVRDAGLRIVRALEAEASPSALRMDLRPLPEPPSGGLRLTVERGGLAEPSGADHLKHTGRLAKRVLADRARALGADAALLVDGAGRVLEATHANAVLAFGGRRVTPALGLGVIPGVVRGVLLASGAVEEARVELGELPGLEEACLANSLLGCCPVRSIDGVAPRLPGPLGALPGALWAVLVDREPGLARLRPGPDRPGALRPSPDRPRDPGDVGPIT